MRSKVVRSILYLMKNNNLNTKSFNSPGQIKDTEFKNVSNGYPVMVHVYIEI